MSCIYVSELAFWKMLFTKASSSPQKLPFAVVKVCALLQGPPGIAGVQGNPGPPGEGLTGQKVIKHYDICDNFMTSIYLVASDFPTFSHI